MKVVPVPDDADNVGRLIQLFDAAFALPTGVADVTIDGFKTPEIEYVLGIFASAKGLTVEYIQHGPEHGGIRVAKIRRDSMWPLVTVFWPAPKSEAAP